MTEFDFYNNPSINSPVFLYVKLTQTLDQTDKKGQPFTLVEFRVAPVKTDLGGQCLYSKIYRTAKAEAMWSGFRASFRFHGYDAQSAIGRFAKVYLVPSKWQDHRYSTVEFVRQMTRDIRRIVELERLHEMGALPWGARDEDEAAEMVQQALAQQ